MMSNILAYDAEYVPKIDGDELIKELDVMVLHQLRGGSVYSLLRTRTFDLAAEGLICDMAYREDDELICKLYIHMFGWALLPYAKYRRDHPPQGDWDARFGFVFNDVEKINRRYREACDLLIEASEAELLRD